MLTIFLVVGLYTFSVLRDIYINQPLVQYYHRGVINVGVRYISFCFVALLISATGILADREFMKPLPFKLKTAFDILLYTSLVWIISSELISIMSLLKYPYTYKLVLSILWGVYSLFLIVMGIWKKKKHLRIGKGSVNYT